MAVWWTVPRFFGRSCDLLAKVQKRMQVYERTAPTATATSLDALPHNVVLAISGCKAFPASHTRPLLYRISRDRLIAKHTTSLLVVLCLRELNHAIFNEVLN